MINESNVNYYAKAFPATFEFAEGDIITDQDGKKYIDFFCGAGALNYGHNHPQLKNALISFVERNAIVHCLDMDSKVKETFLQRFKEIILEPRGLDYKVQFSGPTGTNAVEAAIRLARINTKRRKVIAFTNSFHGMTATSLALSASKMEYQKVNPSQDIIFFPYDQFLGEDVNTIDYLKKMLMTAGTGIELPAAIILETIQAEGGVNIAGRRWLSDLRRLTEELGILLIVDDIQVGCGRTGTFFSFERAGIVPDIVLLSKSISGFGLPLSLVLIKPAFDIWTSGEHNGTFRANNLSLCTAAEALTFWMPGQMEEIISQRAGIIEDALTELAQLSSHVKAIRGMGMIWGIEFANGKIASGISKRLFKDGLIIECCGHDDQVIKILPALMISQAVLEKGLAQLKEAVLELEEVREPVSIY